MKIAIIGTGIAGLTVAHLLHAEHDLTIFEANNYVGGHTHTVPVATAHGTYAVDTGFIVFNDWTYPNFLKLLARIGTPSQPSNMSFSVKCERTGLEYNGTSLNTLFAQRVNFLRPSFYRMLRDILRFNREAPVLLRDSAKNITLGSYLATNRYSQEFTDYYLIPMSASIWSADPRQTSDMPARFLIQFFHNHGMLSVNERPQWRVVTGGSQEYVKRLTQPFRNRIRLRCPIQQVTRHPTHVSVKSAGQEVERFDQVVIAAHSDQALTMLTDPSAIEQEILRAFPYQANETVLHTDESVLPRTRRAWASWNYHRLGGDQPQVAITYNMNMLQTLPAPQTFCVTLNRTAAIDPSTILQTMTYHHPVYTEASVVAQKRHAEINGINRTYFCGAYWGYGFHEDGVNSALAVCQYFGKSL
ncbi:MAG: FAD-dependent oxidoreductase [Deltaproteobacteria bacterium]|nr:FAD-dependent oxidoreductase [Deltaproteobacteria bacterium]